MNDFGVAMEFPSMIIIELIKDFILTLKPHWELYKSIMSKCENLKSIFLSNPVEDLSFDFNDRQKFCIVKHIEWVNFVQKNIYQCNEILRTNDMYAISSSEIAFMEELLNCLSILTSSIGVLERRKYWAYFIPVFINLKDDISKLRQTNCCYINRALDSLMNNLNSYNQKYEEANADATFSIISTCVHPYFKFS